MFPYIVILAGGEGVRMKSRKAKVMHELMGKPIVEWVVDLAKSFSSNHIILVYGKNNREVKDLFQEIDYVLQPEPIGTGNAVSIALKEIHDEEGDVIVLSGDVPLLSEKTLRELITHHKENKCDATLLTFSSPEPTGYGRIIRDGGEIMAIVEEKDATSDQKKIREVNGGIYIFSLKHLRKALKSLSTDNNQSEYYLTDVISLIQKDGSRIEGIKTCRPWELQGINTREDLSKVIEILRRRKIADVQEK